MVVAQFRAGYDQDAESKQAPLLYIVREGCRRHNPIRVWSGGGVSGAKPSSSEPYMVQWGLPAPETSFFATTLDLSTTSRNRLLEMLGREI